MAGGEISVGCVIAGGGPAGIMLGFLLARAGVAVAVLEKHADFLRDFRGDTIHPSTLELMHELGLLDAFLARPHRKVARLGAQIGDDYLQVADFSGLPVHCPYIALMPQWDFLDFLAGQGNRYRGFRLAMQTEVTALLHDDAGRVIGVRATGSEGEVTLRGQLVVAADGRHSTLRAAAGLVSRDIGAPMDVLWLRLSRRPQDGAEQAAFRVGAGRLFVQIDRGDYWQCAFVIPKGGFDRLRQRPIAEFRDEIVGPAPHFADRVGEIAGEVRTRGCAASRWCAALLIIAAAFSAVMTVGATRVPSMRNPG
jgi:2-polyprenyl-6-methoxyphenol hydroxylase-like FAD-dependent oxidoreductase